MKSPSEKPKDLSFVVATFIGEDNNDAVFV